MKKKNKNNKKSIFPKFLSTGISILLLFLFTACTPMFSELEKARSFRDQKKYKDSIYHYFRYINRYKTDKKSLVAAREASQVALFKSHSYEQAIMALRFIVLNTKDITEKIKSQTQIANTYFD